MQHATTLPVRDLDDYVSEENPVRVVEAFIDELDLAALGFAGVMPEPTGRPAYHPAALLKIYLKSCLLTAPEFPKSRLCGFCRGAPITAKHNSALYPEIAFGVSFLSCVQPQKRATLLLERHTGDTRMKRTFASSRKRGPNRL